MDKRDDLKLRVLKLTVFETKITYSKTRQSLWTSGRNYLLKVIIRSCPSEVFHSVKKVFLKFSQNLQENTSAGAFF